VTYSIREGRPEADLDSQERGPDGLAGNPPALFSGDVLFEGSIGRTDLPGGDHQTLLNSIAGLLDTFGDETVVYPGHMGLTQLGRERATNPFLQELSK
jgi:glyoxylase-like metal-dependent hydrolase (beta-lactamase superfamily II)